jgi:hypothetical protein
MTPYHGYNDQILKSGWYIVLIRERLYITAGYSLIQCLKALMSYEDKVSINYLIFIYIIRGPIPSLSRLR